MARTKEQKKSIVEKLGTIVKGSKSLVFVNIHGLQVADATAMRRALKADEVGLFVAKKTLTRLALEAEKYAGSLPDMPGELALAYGADLVAPARGVYDFQKKLKDKVSIVGGVFDGSYMGKDEMTAIAAIPPLKTLYGMFANVVNSPIQGLVMALDQIAKKKQ
ncbi:MAG: 50S ribosomal protein L10 [Patescibacteria group bacterium]|nr:50S ribosomal protein L10 [Patescibacteria group bacterium]